MSEPQSYVESSVSFPTKLFPLRATSPCRLQEQRQPTDQHAEPADHHAEPAHGQEKPEDIQAEPTGSQKEPKDTQAKPTDNLTKPTDTKTKPGDRLSRGFASWDAADRQEWKALEAGLSPVQGRPGHSL